MGVFLDLKLDKFDRVPYNRVYEDAFIIFMHCLYTVESIIKTTKKIRAG